MALALQREPVLLHMELHRLNGEQLDVEVAFPDEVAALTLKAFASQVRDKPTDVVDLWRCLEVAYAAARTRRRSSTARPPRLRASFGRCSTAVTALACRRSWTNSACRTTAADERFTRIRALVQRVLLVA